ncbi:hypothetical protein [Enhygromyxa salina]|uniref:Uncharacterized protein n=1 Tax=Enhygromyxa salina TaxID=215803 RepID=A0A2S9XP01_9BACT|nr:hypothetical protein [Enhygromyxa salina]PRP94599.1 hypothetical protein ENSA7_77680 [Enhygromyxa salina]
MHRTLIPILLATLLAASPGCGDRCDCPPEWSIVGFSLADGEFEGDEWQILIEVDGQLRTMCSSESGDGPNSAVVACDDPEVEVGHNATTLTVTLPEFQEDAKVRVEVANAQGSVWTASATVELRFHDTLDNCLCPLGEGIGELSLSDG